MTPTSGSAATLRSQQVPSNDLAFLAGGGELGALIRAHDWASSLIGPPESWSPSLKMMVSFLLANRFPLLLWWGPHYVSLYNDPYRPVLGTKHPRSLGQPCSECWHEIWHVLQPLIDTPFQGGPATWLEDLELEVNRHGFTEETHFTIAYSPVPDETAPRGIGGVLATVHEITEKVIGERRIVTLRELGARSSAAKTAEEACLAASDILAKSPKDVPFALIYLLDRDGKMAQLVAATGLPEAEQIWPSVVSITDGEGLDCPWPMAEALRTQAIVTINDLPARLSRVPQGPWSDPPHCALIVPIRSNTAHQLAGLLVAGVSSRLRVNDQYYSFFELVAAQIATAIANARAYEDERKRAEALAEIDRAKTAFFSNVSHEFRTPLTLMLGPVEDAVGNPETPSAVRMQLEVAHRNALRLLKLVNSLLDFSRIEAGRVQASYESTQLAQLTSDLASNFRSAIERAGLKLDVDCRALQEPVYVDREMWEKIVLNLLSNAFKFTFQGGISVRMRREGSEAVLEVSDTGVGIPDHELPRVFERFHRVEGVLGRTQEGSGIGLALVQELVKLHGGTISAVSQLGRGSTFRIGVPLGTSHLAADRIKVPRTLASTAIGARAFVEEALRWIPDAEVPSNVQSLSEELAPAVADRLAPAAGARILVADDNADMRGYVRDLLAPTYKVEAVVDGEQALEAARREPPDLILTDIMMPRLDGLGLLKALRSDAALHDIPVILLSARAGEEARVEGLDAGADDYLVKPFSARELLARVSARLELVRMRLKNERRFHAFVRATSEVIYQMSPDWSEMRSLQGRNFIADTEDPSRNWLDKYIHPDDQGNVMAAIQQAVRTKSVFQLEHRVRRVDGSWGWAFSRAIPLFDAKGNIVEWFGAATDVTARKLTEESLREREQALAQALEELKTRTVELARFNQAAVGREMRIIELKREINQLLERLRESARYPLEFDEEPRSSEAVGEPEGEGLVPLDVILRTQELRDRPTRTPDYEAETRALTTLVQALADSPRTILQQLADTVREVLRAGSAGLSLLTRDGQRFYWAAVAGEWSPHLGGGTPRGFGPCGDVLDRNEPLLFTHWELRYPYLASATPLAEEGLLVPFHVKGRAVGTIWAIAHDERKFDTEDLRLLESLGRFASAAYEAVESLGAFDDRRAALSLLDDAVRARALADESLAKLRESERQLRQSEEDLREADRRKNEFLALLGHELRNPLAPISTASEVLSRKLTNNRDAHLVGVVRRQAAQLARLVDDLLDVARITQGRIELRRGPIEIGAVIAQAVESVGPLMNDKQHELAVVSSYEALYVNGDLARLVQCVVNVLTNAAKYTDAGGRIRVQTRAEGPSAVIEVADTGAGISPELLPQVFNLFVQSERTLDRAQGGLGIGLSVVKRLIEMHDGQVTAHSAGLGCGSTFTLRLPRIARPESTGPEPTRREAAPQRILIVDDNEDAANCLAELLRIEGHETRVAYNGPEALACVNEFSPELVLLDIGLPAMDGYQVAYQLRARPELKDLRLVALTGYGQSEDRERTRAAGFDEHLVKPVDLVALQRILSSQTPPVLREQ
jgi:signal transduction histidine kinase/DNA-binding response OmpR family regulator